MPKPKDEGKSLYQVERENNDQVFRDVIKNARPDLYVLMDILDSTGVNYYVVFQIIKHLNNIALGNKYGTVTAHIENGTVTFVRGEESSKLNEPLILEKKKN